MNIEKLTNQLQKAVSEAQSIAVGRDHSEVEPIHILLALLNQEGSSASSVLKKAGFSIGDIKNELEERLEKLPKLNKPSGEIIISKNLVKILNLADRAAQKKNDKFISSEVFLEALIDEKGQITDVLSNTGSLDACL